MAILKLKKKKFHTNTVSIANIGQSWAIKPRVSAIVVKHREKPSHPGILESVPFLTSLGYHTACCPAPGEQINYSSYVPSKETFFFARKGGNSSFSVSPYWELMSPNHNVKEEYQFRYQVNVVFRDAPSWSRCCQRFHGVPGKMQDSLMFQERISFPGNWQVPNGEGAQPFPMWPARMNQRHFAHLSCCYPDAS